MGDSYAYPLCFRDGSSDGKDWRDEDYPAAITRVSEDDKRYVTWRFKLGGLLRDQLFPKDRDRTYYLKAFPENYHLRVKPGTKDAERRDVLLYGYPHGSKPKPFRSTNEFFPHLLWLLGDNRDKDTCTCLLCNPDGQKIIKIPAHIKIEKNPNSKNVVIPQAAPYPPSLFASTQRAPSRNIPPPQKSAQPNSKPAIRAPAPAPAPVAAPQQQIHAPIQQAQIPPSQQFQASRQQLQTISQQATENQADEAFIFREGEVVWHTNANAWRLGLVVQAHLPPQGAPVPSSYRIKPLAHSSIDFAELNKETVEMRPFLAFSVPPVSLKALQDQRIDQLDWEAFSEQEISLDADPEYKRFVLALDASKMAANHVDKSYSTFNQLSTPGSQRERFGGVFLGAEKICTNEVVRLRDGIFNDDNQPKDSPVVMVVHDIIIEHGENGSPLYLMGNVHRLEILKGQETPNQGSLPPSMLREKAFRNEVKARCNLSVRYDWVPVPSGQDMNMPEQAVKGRFYETQKLMPILNKQRFQESIQAGAIEEVQNLLNTRLDSKSLYIGRLKNRAEAFRGTVSPDFAMSFGPNVVEH